MRMVLAACLLASFACHAVGEEKPAAEEKAKFDGRWKLTSIVADGNQGSLAEVPFDSIIIHGESFTVPDKMDGSTLHQGSILLDASSNPHRVEILPSVGDLAGQSFLGIYQVKDDKWTMCLTSSENIRPTDFTANADSKRILLDWQKAEKAKKPKSGEKK